MQSAASRLIAGATLPAHVIGRQHFLRDGPADLLKHGASVFLLVDFCPANRHDDGLRASVFRIDDARMAGALVLGAGFVNEAHAARQAGLYAVVGKYIDLHVGKQALRALC